MIFLSSRSLSSQRGENKRTAKRFGKPPSSRPSNSLYPVGSAFGGGGDGGSKGSALGGGLDSSVTVLCAVFLLFIRSTNETESASTTAKTTAPIVPREGTDLVCEAAEDQADVMEVDRVMVVAVVLERLLVVLGLTSVEELDVLLIRTIDARKLSTTVT